MKIKVTIFKNGIKKTEIKSRIPRLALAMYEKKASEMVSKKGPEYDFTIEEI